MNIAPEVPHTRLAQPTAPLHVRQAFHQAPNGGPLDKLIGKDVAYNAGRTLGAWSRYTEIRDLLKDFREDQPSGIHKAVVFEILMRLRSRYE